MGTLFNTMVRVLEQQHGIELEVTTCIIPCDGIDRRLVHVPPPPPDTKVIRVSPKQFHIVKNPVPAGDESRGKFLQET
jgi:hypothetical protein